MPPTSLSSTRRVAVTGGSCSGKSTFCQRLAVRLGASVHVVDEVATRLISDKRIDQDVLDTAAGGRCR